ncbi:hypothetical protein [Mesobacillus maritimus]|uniref:hypothetical protein n=1 Tax=Mesobacillus maritimus TaxID=1643336 RepID=UPI00384B09AA
MKHAYKLWGTLLNRAGSGGLYPVFDDESFSDKLQVIPEDRVVASRSILIIES